MISQTDKLQGGPLAETETYLPPSTNDAKALSRLNQNFRMSKAQQILRLLRDQDDLNQRFRDCALLDSDSDDKAREDDEDAWSVQEGEGSEGEGSGADTSENEAERRTARRVALRKHRNSVDPGRCKTSMGFHNQVEVTDVPYDTDSDNVTGLDSACSTPRAGPTGPPLSARQAAGHSAYHGPGVVRNGGSNSRLRAYHLNFGAGDGRSLGVPEDCVVQSARSARPKTSAAASYSSSSNSRNARYYRQQPHPESQLMSPRHSHHTAHHYSHQPHQTLNHSQHHHHHYQHQHQQQPRGVGDTRQSIISRLDPHHPMAVRPFCENQTSAEEEGRGPGAGPGAGAGQFSSSPSPSSSQPSTPRGGSRNAPTFNHTEVTLFDMAPTFSRDAASRSGSRRSAAGTGTGGGGAPSPGVARSSSFADHQRVMPASRPLLSVDSSSLPLGDVSPRGPRPGGDDPSLTPRRAAARPTRVKKRVGEIARGAVPTPMHVLSDRNHPAMTVMKLPPLEPSVSKGGSGRDLVCVGKN